jgi:hypothetical protein
VNPAGKLTAFAVVLGVALGGGAAVGKAVGPIDIGGDGTAEHDERQSTDPQHAPCDAGGADAGGDHSGHD